MKKYLTFKLLAVLLVTLGLIIFDLPIGVQKSIGIPESVTKHSVNLGLDLQGGSQLDYKIDLRKVAEKDRKSIVDGVKAVIERRVNGLGVAEPNIYLSELAGEQHIIVELAEIGTISQEDVDTYLSKDKNVADLTDDEKKAVSLEKAKAVVGKTIQLEFKEEKGTVDPAEKDAVKTLAQAALDKIKGGEDFAVVGQEEEQAFPGKAEYTKSEFIFADEIPSGIKDVLTTLKVGEYKTELVETGGNFTINDAGEAVERTGLSIIKLIDETEEVKNAKEVEASHILIAYSGADKADASVTRTEDEAYELAKEITEKLNNGGDFAALAKENSNDASNKDDSGKLSIPVNGDGTYVYDFEQATLALEKDGEITEKPVKTQFGYHIIKADTIKTDVKETKYKYEAITYSTVPDPWKDTPLNGEHFVRADVQLDNFYQPYVTIQFDDEGARLFEEITGRNVNKRVAIFVGGDLISAPNVNEKISGGSAQISGQFTMDEAKSLARDLNTGAIPAPIVLSGEVTIGATLGHSALINSIIAGAIGFLLVLIYMVVKYRLAGLVASGALIIYASILLFLIKAQLPLWLAILIALTVFGFLVFKVINSKDSAWEKFLAFILSCIAFLFLTYLLRSGVVLTLAGIAGIILSIGMAVDANILIFERLKEELRAGKTYKAALDAAFERAWSSIRDSNFSTLLTAAILFYLGSSIIKGFAFNLSAGIIVSMFTALTITKIFLNAFVNKQISNKPEAFGVNSNWKQSTFKFIKNTKIWFTISGSLVGISILAMIIFGMNLGLDFTGGTLLEFKFNEPVTKEVLTDSLKTIEDEINAEKTEVQQPTEESETPAEDSNQVQTPLLNTESLAAIETDTASPVDLTNIQILDAGENSYIIKAKYLTSEVHDKIITKMQERLPEFTEPKFTTIGPVFGQTMLGNSIKAMILAVIMMIVYIAFSFRKVPKEISSWRLGACAIVALLHDIIIVTGFFIILSQIFNVEIDILFITAMLTVFGYSVNDTIVVFDRLREHLIRSKEIEIGEIADNALNETLGRSLNTSITTLLTLVAILLSGTSSIFFFILALTLGIIIGTYSSLFTATPLFVWWQVRAKRAQIESTKN